MTIEQAHMSVVNVSVTIDAPVATVWDALVQDIGQWWPEDFYTGGEPDRREFLLESEPGGRLYEQWHDGGLLWGHVVSIKKNQQLQILGSLFPAFGGPAQWFGTWELIASAPTKTELRFREDALGRVSESGNQDKEAGWRYLMNCLHAHIDGRPAPDWS